MAKPPSVKAIAKEDAQDVPDGLLLPLNTFMGQTAGALAGELTPKENFAQEWKTLRVRAGTSPGSFVTQLRRPVYGVSVERCTVKTGDRPTGAVWADWEATTLDGKPGVKVHAVLGLAAGSVCDVVLLLKAE